MIDTKLRGIPLALAWCATVAMLALGAVGLGVAMFFAALELTEMLSRLLQWLG